jgi:hypothetical protein
MGILEWGVSQDNGGHDEEEAGDEEEAWVDSLIKVLEVDE